MFQKNCKTNPARYWRDEMKTFHEHGHELPNKFIAIFADGSGASIFIRKGDGFCEPDNEFKVPDKEWFINSSGYKWFFPLPDDFKVWESDV